MDDRTREFLDTFQTFLNEVVHAPRDSAPDPAGLVAAVQAHLGSDPRVLPVVTEDMPAHLFVDLDIALTAAQEGSAGTLLGVGGGQQRRHNSFSEILEAAGRYGQFPLGAVDYSSVPTSPDTTREAVSFGLRLLTFEGEPLAVLQRESAPQYGQNGARMEVVTPAAGVAGRFIAHVRAQMLEHSVLRGQVLTLGAAMYEPGIEGIVFHPRPTLGTADIVLPPGLLERVERHVAGVARHRDRLRAAGQHLKRGLLLHGPPGTGKTLTVRYLLGTLPDVTVVLLAGPAIQFIAQATELARALQPAMVVLEDCDLVAEARDHYAGAQPLLFSVLEALDGLSDDADIAFVLTTNRAEVLEPALSQRPGRVDLAVEVPLPDEPARRALVSLYSRGLPLSENAVARAATRTPGTTASFAKELVRRAVLLGAEAGREVTDADLDAAVEELSSESQSLTRSLLGAPGAEPGGYA